MSIAFANSALVRDLPREEIIASGRPLRWWGEHTKRFYVHSQTLGDFSVPPGFITDGASIPRVIWSVLSDTDPDILYPSYAHDFLYKSGKSGEWKGLTRKDADDTIRELMLGIGAPRWKADYVHRALRLFGDRW